MATAPLTFTAPGPGSWQLDAVHFGRPLTRIFSDVFPKGFDPGFREALRTYGGLLETIEFTTVNGLMYFAPRPVGAPKTATAPPPKFLFKLLLWLHPELRRRVAAARQTFATKRWREELRLWDTERKPAAIRAHKALQNVDLAALDDAALLEHARRCLTHWTKMVEQHHRFDAAAILPVGDFLAHATAWTGLGPEKLCVLLSGASDVSCGASPELDRLRAALKADANARARFEQAASARDALIDLHDADGELGAAARDWLDLVSYRLQNGLDFCELTNAETPELLVTSIRHALGSENRAASPPPDVASVRDRVPAPHRAMFDELLAEARMMYRIRDERGLYSDIWAAGIFRHAVLEAGRRLVAAGSLERADLLVEADWSEIQALLSGRPGPSSATLAERARQRASVAPIDAPPTLGPVSAGPPPFAWMPAACARLESAVAQVIAGIWNDGPGPVPATASAPAPVHAGAPSPEPPKPARDATIVRGLGVSAGTFEGVARVIHDVNEFVRLQPGDILVTRATTAAFNVVLPLLGGIVTDRGGTLSHAAIVAREYHIPAVVGSTDATSRIPDGARIRIDGALGEAMVL